MRTPGAITTPESQSALLDHAMERYADGDPSAFATLSAGLADRLHPFLHRLSRSATLAEDLLQETFLRIHRARTSFARGSRVLPWAYAIARNVFRDYARGPLAREVVGRHSAAFLPDAEHRALDADPEQFAIARQLASVVADAIAELPSAHRDAFLLLRCEGLSHREAASVLGTTETAVKLRAYRAYVVLREVIARAADRQGARRAPGTRAAKPTYFRSTRRHRADPSELRTGIGDQVSPASRSCAVTLGDQRMTSFSPPVELAAVGTG